MRAKKLFFAISFFFFTTILFTYVYPHDNFFNLVERMPYSLFNPPLSYGQTCTGTCMRLQPNGVACPSGWIDDSSGDFWCYKNMFPAAACCIQSAPPPPPPPPNCNAAGYVGACTNGAHDCGGASESVHIDEYCAGGSCTFNCSNPYWTYWACNLGNCNPNQTQCIGGYCTPFYSITINVTDPDNGGGVDRVSVHANGNDGTTNNRGDYTFRYLVQRGDPVRASISPKTGYQIIGSDRQTINNVRRDHTIRFSMAQLFSISGNVFDDVNKNRIKDSTNGVPEANISGITMDSRGGISNGGTMSVDSKAGTYTVRDLRAGTNRKDATYTISYTSPYPTGYFLIYPLNGPPSSLDITVGPKCRTFNNLTYGLTCNNGDVSNANFALSNSMPWIQGYGFDMRMDDGFDDKIPANPIYPAYASYSDQVNGH